MSEPERPDFWAMTQDEKRAYLQKLSEERKRIWALVRATVNCPYCYAEKGERCRNRTWRGDYRKQVGPHPARYLAWKDSGSPELQ